MRILHVPVYSSASNLNGCSAWNISKAVWTYLTEKHEDLFVYQLFPIVNDPAFGNWQFRDEGPAVMDRKRVKLISVPMQPTRYYEVGLVTEPFWKLFNPVSGPYQFDIVINERPILAPSLRQLLSFFVEAKDTYVPIVNKDPYVLNQDEHAVATPYLIQQSLGYMVANANVVTSQYEMDLMLDTARPFVSPAMLRRIKQQSVVQPSGTNVTEIEKIVAEQDRYPTFTWSVIDRFSAPSNWNLTLEVLHRVYASGRNCRVQVTTLSGGAVQSGWDGALYAYMDTHFSCPRFEFVRLMPRCHAFLAMNERHSYPQGLMEELAAGLVGIFPNKRWARAILPERYPFWWNTTDEAFTLACWVFDHLEEAREMIAWVPQWMRDTYSTEVCADHMYDLYERLVSENQAHHWNGVEDMIRKTVPTLSAKFGMLELGKGMESVADSAPSIGKDRGAFTTTNAQVYLSARRIGLVDTCDSPDPMFDRNRSLKQLRDIDA